MFRSRSAPWLGAVALLLTPQLASAGPLSWGFRAEAPDGTVLRDVTGLTDLAYSDLFLPDPLVKGVFTGGDIRPAEGHYFETWESAARVTLTDERSGASGAFRLWRGWVREYQVNPSGTDDLVYEGETGGPWPEAVRLTLGGSVYEVRGPGGEMIVTVTPAVATPEPGTLALAGVGLLPLFARVTRRRGSTCA